MKIVFLIVRRDGSPVSRTVFTSAETARAERDKIEKEWKTPNAAGKVMPIRGPYIMAMTMEGSNE